MGRPAFGLDNIMRAVLEACGAYDYVVAPVEKVEAVLFKKGTPLGGATIRKYLEELRVKGFVNLVYGGSHGGRIAKLTVVRKEIPKPSAVKPPAVVHVPKPAPPPPAPVQQPPPPPAQPPPPPPRAEREVRQDAPPAKPFKDVVVALVDYDNVTLSAKDAGFLLSFSNLKHFIRKQGDRVLFADVFLSPVNTSPEVVEKLWDAGFQVIACPREAKDKDAVDTKMNWRARQYITSTNANKILVFSNDRDFRDVDDFAKDFDRDVRVVFVDVAAEQKELEGVDRLSTALFSQKRQAFEAALDSLSNGARDLLPKEKQNANFVSHILRVIKNREDRRGEVERFGFRKLERFVWEMVQGIWRKVFGEPDATSVLSTLVDRGLLAKKEKGDGYLYYELNRSHPDMARILQNAGALEHSATHQ